MPDWNYTKPPLTLEASRIGLLVIDLQNDFCHPEGVFARHGIILPAFDQVVKRVKKIIEVCREQGVRVINLRYIIEADSQGKAVGAGLYPRVRPFLEYEGLRRNSWGSVALADLPQPDLDLEKVRPSGFYATNLEGVLRGLGINLLILAGVYSNQCVESTARDAWARDFNFIILDDCTATFDPKLHQASLQSLSALGHVMDSAKLITLLKERRSL